MHFKYMRIIANITEADLIKLFYEKSAERRWDGQCIHVMNKFGVDYGGFNKIKFIGEFNKTQQLEKIRQSYIALLDL